MAAVAGSESPVVAGPTTKKHQDEETQGLEKVTDYVEETENSAELGQVEHFCFAFDPLHALTSSNSSLIEYSTVLSVVVL